MIIGRDLMQALGVIIDYKTLTVSWEDIRIGMHDFFADSKNYRELHTIMQQSTKPPSVKEQTGRTVRILDAKDEAADLRKICLEQAVHLSLEERQKLLNLLTKYESLFDGAFLGDWGEDEAVDLELQPDAKPHHDRPYRIPQVHRETFRKELERLCQIGVMRQRHEGSEWGTPCFLIPKKNGTVRFLTDFRKLNSKIKRKILSSSQY
jgi:hypothetical protein